MKVTVSLTTIPERINNVSKIIESLLSQTVKPDAIHLYIPYICKKNNNSYIIDQYLSNLQKFPNFKIIHVENDYGPGTKWYYALADKTNDVVIFVDDDVILHKEAIEELLNSYKNFPFNFLGFMGKNNEKYVHAEYLTYELRRKVTLLGGYRGILVPCKNLREHIDILLKNFKNMSDKFLVLDDDYFLSVITHRLALKMFVIKTNYHWSYQFQSWSEKDGVNHESNLDNMKKNREQIDDFIRSSFVLE